MPERPPEDQALVQVADAIRLAYARQRNVLDGTTDWEYLIPSARLQWLELAYAAVSAWTASNTPGDTPPESSVRTEVTHEGPPGR